MGIRRNSNIKSALKASIITAEEYLARERIADYKSEYFNGEIFAMAGASESHNIIAGNIFATLHTQLKRRPCKVYPSGMRLKVQASGLYTYPDVMVVCGEAKFDDEQRDTILNPMLIVEVLSQSTESYVRGAKFAHYRKLASLQEFLLVLQSRPRVEQFSKQEDGRWLLSESENLKESIKLAAVDCELKLEDIYLKVDFQEAGEYRLRDPEQKTR